MIVRNEERIIDRCLAAALPLVDAAVLCDTGSTDATPALAHDYFTRRHVPARICHHLWRGFGANRTAAIVEAKHFVVDDLGWPLDHSYWLFLDADLELMGTDQFDRESLTADAVTLQQHSGWVSYWNLRLARASLEWSVVGRTHEQYTCEPRPLFERFSSLWIHDHGDGGSKVDKVPRDIAWLNDQLIESPEDPRTLFYLAQSYRAIGDNMKALLLYRRRAAIADGHEEVWHSKLCIGQILADAGYVEAATAALTEAHTLDPNRAEPLYELSRVSLRHHRVDDAIAFADRGRSLTIPTHRSLFVHTDIYDHKLDLQFAEAAIGTSQADRGFAACEHVSLSRRSPREALDIAERLAVHYAAPIDGMQFLALRPGLPARYRPCNPSIVRRTDGYAVICRAVNYEQRRLRYRSLDQDGIYRTRNVLMRLDHSFNVVDEAEITLDESPLREAMVRGLEDCRLVACGDRLLFTCVTADRHPSGFVHQSLCRLDDRGSVLMHRPLTGPFDSTPQKNWLPFEGNDGRLHAIYGYDPMTVLSICHESGAYAIDHRVPHSVNAGRWRGSSGPIAWPDGRSARQLVLIHEVVHRQGKDLGWERIYLHRFVELDEGFRPTRVSRPFVFAHKGVEFVCGMAPTHDGAHLVLAIGIEDREAYLGRIAFSRVDQLLNATRLQ